MAMTFEKKSVAVWESDSYYGKYLCVMTGDKWAVFLEEKLIASRMNTLFEAHQTATVHCQTQDDLVQDISKGRGV